MKIRLTFCLFTLALPLALFGCGSSDNEAADAAPSGGDSGTADAADVDAGPPTLNGCTFETAIDMTGVAAITISDIEAWDFGHTVCVIVDAGTALTWVGDLSFHPVLGGEAPTADNASPITIAANGQLDQFTVTLPDAGDFPYFCGNHPSMQGAIYVRAP